MRSFGQFWSSTWGHLTLAGAVVAFGALVVVKQKRARQAAPLPAVAAKEAPSLPRTFARAGQRVELPVVAPKAVAVPVQEPAREVVPAEPAVKKSVGHLLPLGLFAPPLGAGSLKAPYGRMIPCVSVTTLESNHLETPVIGLVTEDVWQGGQVVIPAGAEVHGRASLDRTRERIAVTGAWVVVWRTQDADNGTELHLTGLALDRAADAAGHEHDGSAGLRGTVLRSGEDHALRLFAATFLASATSALQDTRTTAGLIGDASVPLTSARNATLAGTGAILREYAQQLRDAVAKDGFYLRVPAGKPFYLYVTQSIERSAPLSQP